MRIFDTIMTLVIATVMGGFAWFTGRLVVGNVFSIVETPNAYLIVFTFGLASLCFMFAVAALTAVVFAIMFAANHYPNMINDD